MILEQKERAGPQHLTVLKIVPSSLSVCCVTYENEIYGLIIIIH